MALSKEDVLEAIADHVSNGCCSDWLKQWKKNSVFLLRLLLPLRLQLRVAKLLLLKEQTEFDIVLTGIGEKKVNVIKAVRALTGSRLERSERAC